jgi:hypothetical protein
VIKDLRGIVQGSEVKETGPRWIIQGSEGMVFPKVKITLSRDGDHNQHNITVIETDQEGKFVFPKLTDGWYWVSFEPPKEFYQFCRVNFQVKIAQTGWTGLKLSLAPLISVTPGFCENSSKLENLNAKTN